MKNREEVVPYKLLVVVLVFNFIIPLSVFVSIFKFYL